MLLGGRKHDATVKKRRYGVGNVDTEEETEVVESRAEDQTRLPATSETSGLACLLLPGWQQQQQQQEQQAAGAVAVAGQRTAGDAASSQSQSQSQSALNSAKASGCWGAADPVQVQYRLSIAIASASTVTREVVDRRQTTSRVDSAREENYWTASNRLHRPGADIARTTACVATTCAVTGQCRGRYLGRREEGRLRTLGHRGVTDVPIWLTVPLRGSAQRAQPANQPTNQPTMVDWQGDRAGYLLYRLGKASTTKWRLVLGGRGKGNGRNAAD
ncbi:hypothetical protein CHU98_g8082 [Xylaria longipes]|nr:hypothetical protein CHU98_g8082 [Xylaria longipes]